MLRCFFTWLHFFHWVAAVSLWCLIRNPFCSLLLLFFSLLPWGLMGLIIHVVVFLSLAVIFSIGLATVRLTCCWWFFPWLYFFSLGSYCELVMSAKKPLLQFIVAVFLFTAVRSNGTNVVGVSSFSESLVLLLVFNF